jgi:hypothetical protein
MNRPNRPKRWQLDVFMLLMIVLMIVLMQAQLSPPWEKAAEIGWCVLTLLGMGMWVRDNWAALQLEEQQRRRRSRTPDRSGRPESRTIPLTPTQRRFLNVTQAHLHAEDVE